MKRNALQSISCHFLFCLVLLTAIGGADQTLFAQSDQSEAAQLTQKLKQVPTLWNEKVELFTQQDYERTLQYWADSYPQLCKLERRGVTKDGFRIFMLKITDSEVSDDDKQICLMTALHGGPERTGSTTVMKLAEWLLSDAPEAVETRRRQIILMMPVMHPKSLFVTDRFLNSDKLDPYTGGSIKNWDFKTMTYLQRDKAPEIAAFLDVVDEYQPEVIADVHGIGLQEIPDDKLGDRKMSQGMTMFEVTGSAYSNYSLRPWDWRITEKLNEAGEAAGYGYDRFEADAQRMFHGSQMAGIAHKNWSGRPKFYTAQYAYVKYHSMVIAFEVGWEQSGLARLKGLLKIGNEHWQNEPHRGYPVNRVKNLIGHFVTAYGETASERRKSRVELWNKQHFFSQGLLYPQTIGRDTLFVGVSPAAREVFKTQDLEDYIANLENRPEIKAKNLEAFFKSGPEIKVYTTQGTAQKPEEYAPIKHGASFRFRLPYQAPKLIDLRLNGHLLKESKTDGYQAWVANGFTQVQINVPPEKTSKNEFFLGTVAYDPQEARPQGWKPPKAVQEALKAEQK